MQLRDYQQKAHDAIFTEWEEKGTQRTLLVLPTGCGKTIVFAKVAEDCVKEGNKVLILAHRGELLEQASDKIKKVTGLGCAVEKAEQTCIGKWFRIVTGSVQTLQSDKRLSKFSRDYFDTIIIDEAHHVLSNGYQKVLEYFNSARVLGVTATPDRGDMKNLGSYFQTLAYEYTLPEAIKSGYLVPIKALTIPLTLDLSSVSMSAGDFKASDIGSALDPYLEGIASEMAKFCNQFDKIADALGASVIYAHHHSKGAQGGKKSMDRASGSGVFARDPDALLDMIELDMNKEVKEHFINEAKVEAMHAVLDKYVPKWKTYIYQTKKTDDHDFEAMNDYCAEMLGFEQMNELQYLTELKVDEAKHITALQISGTLREFATFDPINCFFKYPIHFLDNANLLKGCRPEGSKKKNKFEKMNETNKKKQDENIELFLNAFDQLNHDGQVTVKELAESGLMMGKTYGSLKTSVPRWIKNGALEEFDYSKGVVSKK